jgi:hypothetical protein
MAQPSSSMTAKPRRHKRTCWAPLWEHVKMIIRPKASPEEPAFGSAGFPCSTACDHTLLRIPTASLDLGTKDNCSDLSTTQEISSIPSPARQKSIDPQYPEDASKEDNTSSGNEPGCDSHPLHRNKELKAFPNVTTNCGLGLTKCNQVASLQDSSAGADKYRLTALLRHFISSSVARCLSYLRRSVRTFSSVWLMMVR